MHKSQGPAQGGGGAYTDDQLLRNEELSGRTVGSAMYGQGVDVCDRVPSGSGDARASGTREGRGAVLFRGARDASHGERARVELRAAVALRRTSSGRERDALRDATGSRERTNVLVPEAFLIVRVSGGAARK